MIGIGKTSFTQEIAVNKFDAEFLLAKIQTRIEIEKILGKDIQTLESVKSDVENLLNVKGVEI